jgi:HEPN domain-containing protein
MTQPALKPTPLPMRDFNQELEKTRGAAHALELALKGLIESYVVADKEEPSVHGVRALAEVLADRLDDLAHMNGDFQLYLNDRVMQRAQ